MTDDLTEHGKRTLLPYQEPNPYPRERCQAEMTPVGWRRDPTDQCKSLAKVNIDGRLLCKTHAAKQLFDTVFITKTHTYGRK